MVAMLVMLLCYAVLLLAQQRTKQSDAMSRFLSPAFPIVAAGGAQADALRLLSVVQDSDERYSERG
jgi:hypothetical protein